MITPRIAIVAATVLVAAARAQAQDNPIIVEGDIPVAVVSYADLNLASPAGRNALEGRVERAASSLCLENHRESVNQFLAQHNCFSFAMRKARIDIDQAVAFAGTPLASERMIKVAAR